MKTIMIVEDEISLANALKLYFEKKHCKVIVATTSEEVFSRVNKSVSVVLLDINIPGELNGLDVLKILKNFKYLVKGTPIMMMTNQSDEGSIKKAKELGSDGYLIKSEIDLNTLYKKVVEKIGETDIPPEHGKLYLCSKACKVMAKIIDDLKKPANEIRVAFVPTASDTYKDAPWLREDLHSLDKYGFNITELDLKDKDKKAIRSVLSESEIVFVAGGNVFYLWQTILDSGFDDVVKDLVSQGLSYIGSSAGSMIAGPDISPYSVFDAKSASEYNQSHKALNLVDFLILPHSGLHEYDSHHEQIVKEYSDSYKIIPLSDKQMIISDGSDYQIV